MKEKKYDIVVYIVIGLFLIVTIGYKIIINQKAKTQKKEIEKTTKEIVALASQKYSNTKKENDDLYRLIFKYYKNKEISTSNDKLNYNGILPKGGTIVVNNEAKVAFALYNDYYCAKKDYDGEVEINKKVPSECQFEEEFYKDDSGASRPHVMGNMLAVVYQNNKWVKADLYQEWYDYDKREWANVVLVTQDKRSHYLYSNPGTEIKEEDVLIHLVWIPRYKYKLFNSYVNLVNEQLIEIEFQSSSEKETNNFSNGNWLTHPAFTFAGEEKEGIWVGKFETTGTKDEPSIKPNEKALNALTLSEQYNVALSFNDLDNYGIMRTHDVHMMKNTEWGAVAYLSQSKYGIYNDKEQIRKNSSSSYITGCAGGSIIVNDNDECQNKYNTENGVKASTTGNIYGIYDMNGGLYEAVMAYTKTSEEYNKSQFEAMPSADYIDKYQSGLSYNDIEAYNRKIYGDATGEVRNWYNNNSFMIYNESPFFLRGGSSLIENTSIFSFNTYNGEIKNNVGFRITMT